MNSRALRIAVLAAVASLPLLAGCASDQPYSVPQGAPQRQMRTPLVAPSGPASPWWWPLKDGWWPGGY